MEDHYKTTHTAHRPTASGHPDSHRPPPSSSDLVSSAKLVADAAKSALQHDANNIDKARLAGAAEDLLGAAKKYGKLEEKSFGKYVDKAEGYLHQYHSSHSTAGAGAGVGVHSVHSEAGKVHHESSHHGDQHGKKSEGGYGEYIKLAEGFLKKPHGGGDGDGHSSSGGAQDYIKLAQGFLKKR